MRHWTVLILLLLPMFWLPMTGCQKKISPIQPNDASSSVTPTPTPMDTVVPSPTPTWTFTPGPTSTDTATPSPTLPDFNLSSGSVTTLNTGTYQFNCVNLAANSMVTIDGGVTIFTQCFNLSAGATLYGSRKASDSMFQGAGYGSSTDCCSTSHLAGGGGHGGPGEGDCFSTLQGSVTCECCVNGGAATDDPVHPTLRGGWGGYTNGICTMSGYAQGGSLLKLVVLDSTGTRLAPATIQGVIDMSGSYGIGCAYHHGGGGAGGTILLETSQLVGSGTLIANGGSTGYGGAGGGGIISLIADVSAFNGITSVLNGNGVANGVVTITAPPASGY